MIVTNRNVLTTHGNIRGRSLVLEILDAGLQAANPYENTKQLICIQDEKLIVGGPGFPVEHPRGRPIQQAPLIIDLTQVRNIYLVGGGKAAQSMAKAVEDVMGDRITDGQVNARKGEPLLLNRVPVTFAGHPIPDMDSVEGAKRMLAIEKKASKEDLVFFTESGGGTALMTLPVPGVSLTDLQDLYQKLYFEQGASMSDANSVRWMLVDLRGRHERHVGDATMIAFHTSESQDGLAIPANQKSPGRRLQPREWSYTYAIKVLKRYGVWNTVASSIREHLLKADPQYDMLKPAEILGQPHYHFRVMGSEYMLDGAKRKAEALGVPAYILSSSLNNLETWQVAGVMAHIAREIEFYARPFPPPCILLFGGELLVTVGSATGVGGRNQEFVLTTASMIAGSENIVIASVDSDGADGPSKAAGGIVDGYTMTRLQKMRVDIFNELDNHNSHWALNKLQDTIRTGIQGTNVRDIRIIYIEKRASPSELQQYVDDGRLSLYGLQHTHAKSS